MLRSLLVALSLLTATVSAASPATDEARRLLTQGQDAQAFERVDAAARRGDEDAIALVGWFYDTGRHVRQDYARAAEYYRRVVRNNPSVQWRLGVMYDLGHGVAENPEEAVRLFRQAADGDDVNAQVSLGVMYANGRGVRPDYVQSMRYYRRAAELGSGAGFLGVGLLYQQGLGVQPSANEAAAWFLAAQALRDNRARDALASLALQPAQMQAAVNRANQLLQSYRRRERVSNSVR